MKSLSLPTVESSRDFYLGGLYALTLFAVIAMLFFQILAGLEKMHSYALKKSTSVTVSLVDRPLTTTKKKDAALTPVPKVEKKSSLNTEKKTAPVEDISSLFSEVKTQKIVHRKTPRTQKKIDSKRIAALQKRIKTTKKRATSATAEEVKKLALVRPSQVAGGSKASGGAEVDAYFAKIQATIYDHFFPPANSEGSVAQVRVWLSASGKMTRFAILRRSGDPLFDAEVDALGKRLAGVTFARNPKGKDAVLDVSLVSKE